MPAFLQSLAAKLIMGLIGATALVGAYFYVVHLQDEVSIANLKNAEYSQAIKTQNDTIDGLTATLKARQDALVALQGDYAKSQAAREKAQDDLNSMIDAQNANPDNDPKYQDDFNKKFNGIFDPVSPPVPVPSSGKPN